MGKLTKLFRLTGKKLHHSYYGELPIHWIPTKLIRLRRYRDLRDPKNIYDSGATNYYRRQIKANSTIDPIWLYWSKGKLQIADGRHRTAAHKAEGKSYIRAVIEPKSPEEARKIQAKKRFKTFVNEMRGYSVGRKESKSQNHKRK